MTRPMATGRWWPPRSRWARRARAQAQTLREPEARQGFYVSAGAGANALAAWDKGQRDGTAAGLAYTIHFGEMLTDRWGLGLAIEGGSAARAGVTTQIAGLTLEAQARLWRHLAAHAGVGVGAAVGEGSLPRRRRDPRHLRLALDRGPELRRLRLAPSHGRLGHHARLRASRRAGRRRQRDRGRPDVERLLVVGPARPRAARALETPELSSGATAAAWADARGWLSRRQRGPSSTSPPGLGQRWTRPRRRGR